MTDSMPEYFEKRVKKELMLEQINYRLTIIRDWLNARQIPWKTEADGTPIRDKERPLIPDYAPVNLNQFCEWDGKNNCVTSHPLIAKLRKISRQPLYNDYHKNLRKEVETAYKAVSALLVHQLETADESSKIKALESKISAQSKIIDVQAKESREARHKLVEITITYRKRHEEQRRIISQLKLELAQSEAKTAEAISQLAKILPLRAATKKR
ncbi:MAG: hypothetical protein EOP06_17000 [Proteobacteria bacterium]|nr:MAG: hypothetical protein EOP06_17000 [Pseudomonadota bacterium]